RNRVRRRGSALARRARAGPARHRVSIRVPGAGPGADPSRVLATPGCNDPLRSNLPRIPLDRPRSAGSGFERGRGRRASGALLHRGWHAPLGNTIEARARRPGEGPRARAASIPGRLDPAARESDSTSERRAPSLLAGGRRLGIVLAAREFPRREYDRNVRLNGDQAGRAQALEPRGYDSLGAEPRGGSA